MIPRLTEFLTFRIAHEKFMRKVRKVRNSLGTPECHEGRTQQRNPRIGVFGRERAGESARRAPGGFADRELYPASGGVAGSAI